MGADGDTGRAPAGRPSSRLRAVLAPLRWRDFRLLFLGQTLSLVGGAVTPVALAFAVLDLTGSASAVGLVFAAQLVPLLALLLLGGVWADRFSRRRVMIAADVVRFGGQAVLGLLLISGRASLLEIVAFQALKGTAEAFFSPAATGLVPQTVDRESLQQANALRGLSQSFGSLAGPVLGGVLVASVGAGWAIELDAASYLASALFLLAMRPHPAAAAASASVLSDLAQGWHEFTSRAWLWITVVQSGFFMMLALGPLLVLGPVIARASLGGARGWGVVLAAMGLGEIVGGVAALRLRPARPLLAGGLTLPLYGALLALLALRAPLPAVTVGAVGAGLSVAWFEALWATALQEHVPDAVLSRVSSYDWLGSLACLPLGLLLAGPVSQVLGTGPTLWAGALATAALAATAVAVPAVRGLRRGVPEDAAIVEADPTAARAAA